MRPFKKLAAVIASAAALAILLTGCDAEFIDGVLDLVSDLESELDAELDSGSDVSFAEMDEGGAASGKSESGADGIPFRNAPEITKYELPPEDFDDPVEKQASEIIDGAISTAVSCVRAMRDSRHSSVAYPYDPDSNGYISALDRQAKSAYEKVIAAAQNGRTLSLGDKEYGEGLKKVYTALNEPLNYCRPDVGSFLMLVPHTYVTADYETHYSSVDVAFFDPYRDRNAAVSAETAAGYAKLLDHVVRRVIRFMPEGLTTYDKYYYLAAVVSARAVYDDRPENSSTAFGALITGKAVCGGYSRAFYLLCREADLWCAYRFSKSHMWNTVKLDSGVFNVDVTWCDSGGEPYSYRWYEYFVKSDETFDDETHAALSGVAATGGFEPCPYE